MSLDSVPFLIPLPNLQVIFQALDELPGKFGRQTFQMLQDQLAAAVAADKAREQEAAAALAKSKQPPPTPPAGEPATPPAEPPKDVTAGVARALRAAT